MHKMGQACATGILGAVAWGDASKSRGLPRGDSPGSFWVDLIGFYKHRCSGFGDRRECSASRATPTSTEVPMRRILTVATLLGGSLFCLVPSAQAATVNIGPNGEFLVDGKPFLPVMQWLQSSSRIAYQKGLGINTFVGNGGSNSSAEYLAECQAQHVWCVMDPADMSVAAHPALLGWIFGDEPDLDGNDVEPAEILTQYRSIKGTDPSHVTLLTVTSGFFSEMDPPDWMNGDRSRYYAYAQATDAVGFDLYPVYGWCRPDWLYRVGAAQEGLAATYAPDRSTYQWIECSRTSGQWCDIDDRKPDDGPTPQEVRNEVWQAITKGAKAIGYFTHSWECDGYTQFCLSAEQEAELVRTNAQLSALTVPILSARYEESVTVNSSPNARIDWLAQRVGSEVTLFAVNVERSTIAVSFGVPGLVRGNQVQVYDENRRLSPNGDTFTDSFDPLAVHIYQMAVDSPAIDGGPGTRGTGGASNAGGAPPTGGAGNNVGGNTSSNNSTVTAAAGSANSQDTGSCSCRVSGNQPSRSTSLAGLGLLTLAILRTMRRRQSRSDRSTY